MKDAKLCILVISGLLQLSASQTCTGGYPMCSWTSWEAWSQCDRSCGGGTRQRSRKLCCLGRMPVGECLTYCGLTNAGFWDRGSCNTHCYNSGTFSNNRCNCRDANFGSCCQDTIECGHPGNIAHGRVLGNNFYFGGSVTYTCNTHFNLTGGDWRRTCQRLSSRSNSGVWSGRQPRCAFVNSCESNPCQNDGTCVDSYDRYDCDCSRGWSGRHCELDILPPSVLNCPDDRQHFTEEITESVNWNVPEFYDEFGNDVTVTSNFPSSSADFWWGDNIIKYTGRKENNALTTTCSFNEAVDPHPCDELPAPEKGAIACNAWNARFSRVCAYFCQEDLTFGPGNDIRQLLVCGADGNWTPVMPEAKCSQSRLRDPDVHHFPGRCSESETELKNNYVSILTSSRSPFNQLCDEFPEACLPQNVNVTCYPEPEPPDTTVILPTSDIYLTTP